MKQLIFLLLILPLLRCGGSDPVSDQPNRATAQTDTTRTVQQTRSPAETKPEPKEPDLPTIKEVKFTSMARVNTDLELATILEIPDNETLFDFRWFVNDEEIFDTRTNILPSRFFKSGDWVHCRVKAIRGGLESGMVKSKHIMIQGTPPVLDLLPVGAFDVPGRFQYRIRATDPDLDEFLDLDRNTLTYELVSPRDAGISLNSETGEISWDLTEEIVARLGTKIEIKFKVTKKGAPSVGSSITLNFSPSAEQQEPNPDESTEE